MTQTIFFKTQTQRCFLLRDVTTVIKSEQAKSVEISMVLEGT